MFRCCGLIVSVSAVFAAAWAAVPESKFVKLTHVQTGKVLAVENSSEEPAAHMVVAKDGEDRSQQWQLHKDGEHYKLMNRKSGQVLDVDGDSREAEAAIIQWEDKPEDNDNQRWSWVGEGDERRLKSKSSELMLDVDAGGNAVQRPLDKSAKSQLWKISPVKE